MMCADDNLEPLVTSRVRLSITFEPDQSRHHGPRVGAYERRHDALPR